MKVSVLMITYNHEKYIAQAIDSVMMQETNFDFELVIGEDCSNDQTREITLAYKRKFPSKIKLLLPESNLGMMKNLIQTLRACKGKYIALLEGDDYWTDPHKLQKQVDFLEAHPDFAICFHKVKIIYEGESREPYFSDKYFTPKDVSTIDDLCKRNYIMTASCLFRNKLFGSFPKWFITNSVGDWPLHLLNAEHGKIKYLDDVMAVYRVHDGGIWSFKNPINKFKEWINLIEICDKHFNYKYHSSFMEGVSPCYSNLISMMSEEKQLNSYLKYWLLNIKHNRKHLLKEIIKPLIKLLLPKISFTYYRKLKLKFFHIS